MKKNLSASLGFTTNTKQLVTQISVLTNQKNKTVLSTLSKYNPDILEFISPDGILKGEIKLKEYITDPKNKGKKVFAKYQVKADLALDGGGAYGFAHLGVPHALAYKGIGFDRISGTSAGAIAGALLAAGYEIDLNFSTDTDVRTNEPLVPNPNNSANEILLNDFFKPFTDMPIDAASVSDLLDESWFIKAIETKLDEVIQKQIVDNIDQMRGRFSLIRAEMESAIFKQFNDYGLTDIINTNIPGVAFSSPAAAISSSFNTVFNALNNGTDATRLIATDIANNLKRLIINNVKSSLKAYILDGSINVKNYSVYGLLRLLQYGGFWNGAYLRNWIEYHLQQKVTGTGKLLDGSIDQGIARPNLEIKNPIKEKHKRAVTFKDLPIDLCITTTVVGKTREPFDARNIRIVYFSKKTSPDYPVAEAVRRSMSLPFVFIPRELGDGYAGSAPVLKTSDYDPNDDLTQPSDIKNLKEPFVPDNMVCLDGGFLLNIPVAVFRDKSNEIFDCHFKNNEFQKLLLISNLSGAIKSSLRPFDVPKPRMQEPLDHLMENDIWKIPAMLFGGGDLEVSRGMDKTMLSLSTILTTSPLGIWKDFEIDVLLRLVPNSILVETPLRDPNIDSRLDGGEFNMPKTTKKWLLKNAFDAVRLSLKETEEQFPLLSGKLQLSQDIDPYLHLLNITNVSLLSDIVPANASVAVLDRFHDGPSPAKFGDTMYKNNPLIIEKVVLRTNPDIEVFAFGAMSKVYSGFGYTWIKIENNKSNIINNEKVFIKFWVNIRSKITILLDVKPGFADEEGWIEEPWQMKGSNGIFYKAYSKKYNKGEITIPGPRYITNRENRFAFSFLVRPV